MPRLQAKSFASPDEVREFPNLRFETVSLDDTVVGYCRFDAGWVWSRDVGPVFGSTSCPIRHVGYSVSGACRVRMDDGTTIDIGPHSIFEIPPGHDQWVVGDEPWVSVEWGASGRAIQEALEDTTTRTLATVLFTDVVDSTAVARRLGDARWRDLLASHNQVLRQRLNLSRGREVGTTGDGILAIFDSPTRAVRCAVEMIRSTRDGELRIRAGVHTGEVETLGDDVRGIAVHVASRLLAIADANEVVVSATTYELIEGSGFDLEDIGQVELKGLPGRRQLYRLRVDTTTA